MKKDDVMYTLKSLNVISHYEGKLAFVLTGEMRKTHEKGLSRALKIDPEEIEDWKPRDWVKRGGW